MKCDRYIRCNQYPPTRNYSIDMIEILFPFADHATEKFGKGRSEAMDALRKKVKSFQHYFYHKILKPTGPSIPLETVSDYYAKSEEDG